MTACDSCMLVVILTPDGELRAARPDEVVIGLEESSETEWSLTEQLEAIAGRLVDSGSCGPTGSEDAADGGPEGDDGPGAVIRGVFGPFRIG